MWGSGGAEERRDGAAVRKGSDWQDNALRLHASLGFCRLVDGDEFVALGFQVVDDGGQRVHVYQPKPI